MLYISNIIKKQNKMDYLSNYTVSEILRKFKLAYGSLEADIFLIGLGQGYTALQSFKMMRIVTK